MKDELVRDDGYKPAGFRLRSRANAAKQDPCMSEKSSHTIQLEQPI